MSKCGMRLNRNNPCCYCNVCAMTWPHVTFYMIVDIYLSSSFLQEKKFSKMDYSILRFLESLLLVLVEYCNNPWDCLQLLLSCDLLIKGFGN